MRYVQNNQFNQKEMYTKIKLDGGFTFLESIFQLFVLLLVIPFVTMLYSWLYDLQVDIKHEDLEWEMFIFEMRKYIENSDLVFLTPSSVNLTSIGINGSEVTKISRYGTYIRKQVDSKGHVPLLMGVKTVNFEQKGDFLSITVEQLDGDIKERSIFVGKFKE